MIADPLGTTETPVVAPTNGVVIGRTNLPLAYEGDAIFHIAQYGRKVSSVEKQVVKFHEEHQPEESISDIDPLAGEAPIA